VEVTAECAEVGVLVSCKERPRCGCVLAGSRGLIDELYSCLALMRGFKIMVWWRWK